MNYYTAEQVAELLEGLSDTQVRTRQLLEKWTTLELCSDRAKEFARHGFARRIQTLERCLQVMFDRIPPGVEEIPGREDLLDATIAIQTFIINVFGALDNLAWAWVEESGLMKPDGTPLQPTEVGLTPNFAYVRNSLSEETRNQLLEFGDWFDRIINLRHALAHRIPLYIPPHCVDPNNAQEYQQLDRDELDAIRAAQWDELERIRTRQRELEHFKPFMMHSFSERAPQIEVHPQLLADFATIEVISNKMYADLLGLEGE